MTFRRLISHLSSVLRAWYLLVSSRQRLLSFLVSDRPSCPQLYRRSMELLFQHLCQHLYQLLYQLHFFFIL